MVTTTAIQCNTLIRLGIIQTISCCKLETDIQGCSRFLARALLWQSLRFRSLQIACIAGGHLGRRIIDPIGYSVHTTCRASRPSAWMFLLGPDWAALATAKQAGFTPELGDTSFATYSFL